MTIGSPSKVTFLMISSFGAFLTRLHLHFEPSHHPCIPPVTNVPSWTISDESNSLKKVCARTANFHPRNGRETGKFGQDLEKNSHVIMAMHPWIEFLFTRSSSLPEGLQRDATLVFKKRVMSRYFVFEPLLVSGKYFAYNHSTLIKKIYQLFFTPKRIFCFLCCTKVR